MTTSGTGVLCFSDNAFGFLENTSRQHDSDRPASQSANTVDAYFDRPHSPVYALARPSLVTGPVDQLSDGQRDCLRLVYRHMTSKDIARALDISPHTVDMRLRNAMRTLGVASRTEAALMLARNEADGQSGYQPLIYQAPGIAGAAHPGAIAAPASTHSDDHASQQSLARSSPEVDPPAGGPPRPAGASTPRSFSGRNPGFGQDSGLHERSPVGPLPFGARNTLTPGARIAWIALIAIGSSLGFGAILGGLEALKNLL